MSSEVTPIVNDIASNEVARHRKRTSETFLSTNRLIVPAFPEIQKIRVLSKVLDEYKDVAIPKPCVKVVNDGTDTPLLIIDEKDTPKLLGNGENGESRARASSQTRKTLLSYPLNLVNPYGTTTKSASTSVSSNNDSVSMVINELESKKVPQSVSSSSITLFNKVEDMRVAAESTSRVVAARSRDSGSIPKWHQPWKLMRVISGHQGWVQSLAVDHSNLWFATGSYDRTIKIWDLAAGTLKLTLTGHISPIRDLKTSHNKPYLYSASEDKTIKCWDMETNSVARTFNGSHSAVYSVALHPTLDLVASGGRDAHVRIWDERSAKCVMSLLGHQGAIFSVVTRSTDPQVISGGQDGTVRLWDLRKAAEIKCITNHKKAVRSIAFHSQQNAFISASQDSTRKFALPDGILTKIYRNVSYARMTTNGNVVYNASGEVINCVEINEDDSFVVTVGDNGTLAFYDYETGYAFQNIKTIPQPGSLDAERGIFNCKFDRSCSRLITTEADKTIKMWKPDDSASPETHPIDIEGWNEFCRTHREY